MCKKLAIMMLLGAMSFSLLCYGDEEEKGRPANDKGQSTLNEAIALQKGKGRPPLTINIPQQRPPTPSFDLSFETECPPTPSFDLSFETECPPTPSFDAPLGLKCVMFLSENITLINVAE